jgi:hypothetical protein
MFCRRHLELSCSRLVTQIPQDAMTGLLSHRSFTLRSNRILPVVLMLALCPGARADEKPNYCGHSVSNLNDNVRYHAFDRDNGAKPNRLRFQLEGREPCGENECTLHVISAASGTDKVIATVDLTHQTTSYCVFDLKRVEVVPDLSKAGCPADYLLNEMSVRFSDEFGPYSLREVRIDYMYRIAGRGVSLDQCTRPDDVDGVLRRRVWTVPLDDGSAAYVAETDIPRNLRGPVPLDPPFAVEVFGANNDAN